MDVVYFIYGLSFFFLGIAVQVQPKDESAYDLAGILWLLAAFALLHAVDEWLDLWKLLHGTRPGLEAFQALNLLISYLFLFEFGRRLLRIGSQEWRWHSALERVLRSWIYIPLVALLLLGTLASEQVWDGLTVWAKYLFASLAGLMTGSGFLTYYHRELPRLRRMSVGTAFYVAGSVFLLYAVLSGLVPPPAEFFPANTFNTETFFKTFGIPIQLARAGIALAAAIAITRILGLFTFETKERLHNALGEVQRVLAETRRVSDRMRLILETTAEGIIGLDTDGRVSFANHAAVVALKIPRAELIGTACQELFPAEFAQDCPFRETLRTGKPMSSDRYFLKRSDNTTFPVFFTSCPITEDGELMGTVVAFWDATERRTAEHYQRLTAQIINSSPEGVLITDNRGRIESANPAFYRTTGYHDEELRGKKTDLLKSGYESREHERELLRTLHQTGHWQGERWLRRKSGEVFPEWLSISVIRNEQEKITNYVGIFSDVVIQEHMQQRLHRLAYYDPLTNLPNRQLFTDRLQLALVHARRDRNLVAVMFLDLDRFKNINDTLGHSVGDGLLIAVSTRLQSVLREGDTVARLGGDEFTFLLPRLDTPGRAAKAADKLVESFTEPFHVGHEYRFHITPSIGISVYPYDGTDLETLTKNADTALYRAKELGGNNYQFYTPEMSRRFHERVALERDLRRALDKGEFYLAFQPQVDLATNRIVGIEALVRWHHPDRGELPPEIFIPIAEDSGLIIRLGEWVLREACRQAKHWQLNGRFLRLAVNLSARQLQRGLDKTIGRILNETGLSGESLELELTESVLMRNDEPTRRTLKSLNAMGIHMAIDDFGTGYSSLSYLKQFSIDKLKIDQSFVRDLPDDANDVAIAKTIIGMAHSLKLKVIAEGVETKAQLDFLKNQGCDEIQGYFVSPPAPAEDIHRLLATA